MFGRPVIAAFAASASVIAVSATLWAPPEPSLVAPTTTPTTTPPLVIVVPPSTRPPMIVTPTTSTTTTEPAVFGDPTTTTTAPLIVARTTTPTVATTTPVIATPTVPPDEDPADVPIGEIDPSGAVPDEFDLSAIPDAPAAPTAGGGDGPTFSAGMTCFNQCIKSGVAYPRGFGALLVVETHVPARLWLGISADTTGNGSYDFNDFTTSDAMVTEFSWALDHLDPGQTYYVIVAATDDNDDTAHAYGSFTTLSQRAVAISVGNPTVTGGPANIVDTDVYLKVADLDYRSVAPPESLTYYSLPRHLDLALKLFRRWATSQYTLCEGWYPDGPGLQGDSDGHCGTWNTATLADLDLDAIPNGRTRWTEVSITRTLQTPAGDGALPPGYGDPRYFDVDATVTLAVNYS